MIDKMDQVKMVIHPNLKKIYILYWGCIKFTRPLWGFMNFTSNVGLDTYHVYLSLFYFFNFIII